MIAESSNYSVEKTRNSVGYEEPPISAVASAITNFSSTSSSSSSRLVALGSATGVPNGSSSATLNPASMNSGILGPPPVHLTPYRPSSRRSFGNYSPQPLPLNPTSAKSRSPPILPLPKASAVENPSSTRPLNQNRYPQSNDLYEAQQIHGIGKIQNGGKKTYKGKNQKNSLKMFA